MIKVVRLMKKKYQLDIDDPHLGSCDLEVPKYKRITVNGNIDTKEGFETLIHELLHACFPKMSEDNVENAAIGIAGVLRDDLKFRRKKHGRK